MLVDCAAACMNHGLVQAGEPHSMCVLPVTQDEIVVRICRKFSLIDVAMVA